MNRMLAAAALYAGVLGSSGAAWAASAELQVGDGAVRKVLVPFGDLDLGKDQGAEILLRRIRAAAQRVCGPGPSNPLDLGGARQFDRCVRESMDAAVGQLRAPQVSALYDMDKG